MRRNYINELCQKVLAKNKINLLLTNNEFMMRIDNKYFFAEAAAAVIASIPRLLCSSSGSVRVCQVCLPGPRENCPSII